MAHDEHMAYAQSLGAKTDGLATGHQEFSFAATLDWRRLDYVARMVLYRCR